MPSVAHFNVGCYLIIVRDFLFSTSFILDTIDENSGKKKVVRRKLNGCSKFPGTVSVKNRPSCFFLSCYKISNSVTLYVWRQEETSVIRVVWPILFREN